MKILALLTDGFGSSGGIAKYNVALMTALSQSTSVSGVIALPRYGSVDAELPEGVWQAHSKVNAYLWALHAVYLAAGRGVDVIFCGHINAAPFASLLSRITGKPLWVQAHGIEAWDDRGPNFRKTLLRASLVTVVSRFTRRRLLAWSDMNPEHVRVLPNTFDPSFSDTTTNANLVRKLGVEGKRVILTVGRLSSLEQYKGHDRVIRALPAIREIQPDVFYIIVGTGDDQDRLAILARDLCVSDIVYFAGLVSDQDLNDYYALADVFVMPSTGEGFGIVFLEAAAAGLKIIAGNQDGSADALLDGEIGVIMDPNDIDELILRVTSALQSVKNFDIKSYNRFKQENYSKHVSAIVRKLFAKFVFFTI